MLTLAALRAAASSSNSGPTDDCWTMEIAVLSMLCALLLWGEIEYIIVVAHVPVSTTTTTIRPIIIMIMAGASLWAETVRDRPAGLGCQ
jgi:hypothetical protein